MKKNPHAIALGKQGGKSTSERKTAAARENGRKGGRPARSIEQRNLTSRACRGLIRRWKSLQRKVQYGSAGVYIGDNSILAVAGNTVSLQRKPRANIQKFHIEAFALGLVA